MYNINLFYIIKQSKSWRFKIYRYKKTYFYKIEINFPIIFIKI